MNNKIVSNYLHTCKVIYEKFTKWKCSQCDYVVSIRNESSFYLDELEMLYFTKRIEYDEFMALKNAILNIHNSYSRKGNTYA